MSDRYKEMWEDAFHDSLEMKAEISELKSENARLKAEVERLQSIHSIDSIGIEQLKAEVERLTKVGDVMAIMLQHDEVSKDWNAAKEGKTK